MMYSLEQLRGICSEAEEGKDIYSSLDNIVLYKESTKVYMRISSDSVEELRGNKIISNWDDELEGSIIQVVLDTKDNSYVGVATDRGYECSLDYAWVD